MKSSLFLVVLPLAVAACAPAPQTAPPKTAETAMVAATPCPTPAAETKGRLRLRVTLAASATDAPALSGRMVVAMTTATDVKGPFELDWDRLSEQWKAGMDVPALARDGAVEVDPDVLSWPKPFSQAPPGTYKIAAYLRGADGRAVVSPVVQVAIDPANAGTIDLRLETKLPAAPAPTTQPGVEIVRFDSKVLSDFYGRPIAMDAIVWLPPSYGKDKRRRYATEYYVFGFGGSVAGAYDRVVKEAKASAEANAPEMVHVMLPGNIPSGHHVFADSVNQGPWGRALVEELVPHLEKKYALIAAPRARLLGGHSSGGWASLWLQINHPDFFGGTWSTAPDPVDLRSFTGIDVTPGSKESFYRKSDGSPRGLFRVAGKDLLSIEDFAKLEQIDGDVGPLGTFEWVFSPRGPTGAPLPLYDRATGKQDPLVQQAWAKWDIRKVLEARWATLGPKLKGKLHLFVGGADTFHLDESMVLLCEALKTWKSDATCEVVPGKTHFDLLGDAGDKASLQWRTRLEMERAAGTGGAHAPTKKAR